PNWRRCASSASSRCAGTSSRSGSAPSKSCWRRAARSRSWSTSAGWCPSITRLSGMAWRFANDSMTEAFERGVVVMSIDTEMLWGYHDELNETSFEARYPNSPETHTKLLKRLTDAGVSATWFVVGALALPENTRLLHCRPFLERLRDATPAQEIGLHGGLTHL